MEYMEAQMQARYDAYNDALRQEEARADNAEALAAILLECLKDARRLLTDQEAIDLEYVDEVIAKATK